jgi:diguanylate cyclase (GGDEF)-like protein
MWLLGLSSLAAVLVLQDRLDQRRRAQVAVAELRLQMNEMPRVALDITHRFTQAEVRAQLRERETAIAETAASLDGLSGDNRDARLIMTRARPAFALLDRVNTLASSGHFETATDLLGLALLPGAAGYELNGAFDQIGAKYGRQATSARELADIGSVGAIVLVLIAFSLALHRAARLARENKRLLEQSREDALTDDLTGLPNRRKLFVDVNALLEHGKQKESFVLGMFDLNGFKAYNDMFGHPAGDALLARLGQRLVATVDGAGNAYRMGGDEFCVIARGAGAEALLERARETLTEHGEGFSVSCSLGTIRIAPGEMAAAEAFHMADQHLYDDKRSSRMDEDATEPALFTAA